ncbi:hypothetical protein [Streptomyces sp. NPDC001404]|uniref:hypothetical protein n=1 Tax=Streptomyces sp. NPDC001404 TaxID=3364571 RepID=UPI00368FA47F
MSARTAPIVGASRALGLGLATEFAHRGWDVIGTVRGDRRTGLHDLAEASEGRVSVESVDMTEPKEIAALRERLAERTLENVPRRDTTTARRQARGSRPGAEAAPPGERSSTAMPGTTPAGLGPREVLARYRQAILDKSADDLADLYSVDGVQEFPFLLPGVPARYVGREEVRAGYRAMWGGSPVRPREIREVAVHQSTDPEVVTSSRSSPGRCPRRAGPSPFRASW